MRAFSNIRAAVLLGAAVAAFATLGGRVAYLQTYGRELTVRQAERQQHRQQTLQARRGCVFDRNGMLMAGTIQSKIMFVDPRFMAEEFKNKAEAELKLREERAALIARGKKVREITAEEEEKAKQIFPARYEPWNGVDASMDRALTEVAMLIGYEPSDIIRTVRLKPDSSYVKVALRLDDAAVEAVNKLKIPGIGFQPMSVRAYPMDDLASHILGGISADNVGIDGLEARYDRVLRGKDGFLREMTDSRGKPIGVAADDFVAPVHGRHIVLTIDANIQMIAEQELRASIREFNAKRGEVIVMDPWSGEILALANWPTYRPAEYLQADKEARINAALVAPYEPGSTIKPFIVAPAVDFKLARITEIFDTHNGHYRTSYGRPVTDVHAYASLTLWDVLVKSSNIGMALLAERMGNDKLYDSLTTFGFGAPTGIELPGESGGLVNPRNKWTKYSTESVAQGYEVMVTPLQLARGMSAIANGGRLVQPTIVKGAVEGQGDVGAFPSARKAAGREPPTVLSPTTTAEIRRVLADVLVRGTGSRARSSTYNIFGKTGTAHLTEVGKKGYSQSKYTSSFVGSAPFEHPRLVVAFIIHEAEKNGKNYYGGTTAAPGAALVLERTLRYLGEPPSPPLPPPPASLVDNLYNYSERPYKNWPENVIKERSGKDTQTAPMPRPPGTPAEKPVAPGINIPPIEPPNHTLPADPNSAQPAGDPG